MTPLGYFMLPIGLIGLFFSKEWLYRLFVFSTLFSASSAINFGEGKNGSALQVWMFFGFLWLLRLVLDGLSTLSFPVDKRIVRPCLWLVAFLCVASASLAMPLFINGKLAIDSPFLGEGTQTPLYLTLHNVTQVLYLIFGGMIAICVAHWNLNQADRNETERVILFSASFIAAWGLFQFFCNVTGLPYPDFIFNNSGSASGQGFAQTLGEVGIGRISSATVEPSVFAQSLIALLPLALPAWLRKGSVFSTRIDRWCSLLFVVALILSTSSTAYLGLMVLSVLVGPMLVRVRMLSRAKAMKFAAMAIIVFIVFAGLAALSVPVVRNVADTVLLSKGSSGSGIERLMTITLAFGYFQKYPILGIGWGSATSHDLIVKLLSNVGVVGAFVFFGAMLAVLRANWHTMRSLSDSFGLSRIAWMLALSVFLSTSVLIGFPLAFGNFWLILGMAIATSRPEEKDRALGAIPDAV